MRKLLPDTDNVDALYLDSNSIVYDCLRSADFSGEDPDAEVAHAVVDKIDQYIADIRPGLYTYIAFDGVAPVAKTTQQRERRYRSSLERAAVSKTEMMWNTSKITPGTPFMDMLMSRIRHHYATNPSVKLHGSDERGEGEHKIFEHIRSGAAEGRNVVVYGLDADLIMLGLVHLSGCASLSLYRETPVFIRSVCARLEPLATYLLDLNDLASRVHTSLDDSQLTMEDYVFMCFVLGNDFLPHFPSLSLRDGGHDAIMDVLRASRGKRFTNGTGICWGVFKQAIQLFADRESRAVKIKQEKRERMQRSRPRKRDGQTPQEARLDSIPLVCQGLERYVDSRSHGWRERYYKSLVGVERGSAFADAICLEYLRGLEWTWAYYVAGCKDWRWKYPVAYPPLMIDLVSKIPDFEMELLPPSAESELTPLEQLQIVMPSSAAECVPACIREVVRSKRDVVEHKWAFCRYFWEGNIEFRDDSPVVVELVE